MDNLSHSCHSNSKENLITPLTTVFNVCECFKVKVEFLIGVSVLESRWLVMTKSLSLAATFTLQESETVQ